MAKKKKLTVKIFENRQLNEIEKSDLQFYPLYTMITFERKLKTIKSPTFELLLKMNTGYDLITENWEAIRLNDERLFSNFRSFIETKNLKFSVDMINSNNPEYIKAKEPILDYFSIFLRSDLFKVLNGNDKKQKFPATIFSLSISENVISFLEMIRELRSDLFEEWKKTSPQSFTFFKTIEELESQNIFPFMVDIHVKEPFLTDFFDSV